MNRINPDIDIISDLLKAVLKERPTDTFCSSLLQQYQQRGGLSKKQLEGLLVKAIKFTDTAQGKLATLEAIIKRKHTNHRSQLGEVAPPPQNDEKSLQLIAQILEKYPAHKRVLLFKIKADKQELLSTLEKEELQKFARILFK
ncbi:MAG: hypothetical protein WD135_02010 [Ferruginibacter sp.]